MRMSRNHSRPGYTLMEMLLVMALIVIIAAISIPVMQSMLSDSAIVGAGDLMRGRMAEARARAMDQGRVWKLGFIANSRTFQLAPEDSTEWNNTSTDVTETADVIRGELPKEVYFGLKYEDIMNGSEPATPGSNWETAAIYTPDGSARDDTTTYFGKLGLAPMRIKLRGLTGVVTVESFLDAKGT